MNNGLAISAGIRNLSAESIWKRTLLCSQRAADVGNRGHKHDQKRDADFTKSKRAGCKLIAVIV